MALSSLVIAIAALVAFAYGPSGPRAQGAATAPDPSCYGPTIEPGVQCPGEETDAEAAINRPTAYAWSTFAQLNQPAFPGDSDDRRRVWETWKSADYNGNPAEAIYLDDGSEPKAWEVTRHVAPPAKVLVPIQQFQFLKESRDEVLPFPDFVEDEPLAEEVRVNRPAFNFIREHVLYNRQGQYRYASANPNFDFPQASKEVKAVWHEADSSMNLSDYYSAEVGGKAYVLVAMHITTKDIPFWHWSSFVHKDQNKTPKPKEAPVPLAQNQDVPMSLRGTVFKNYRLIAERVRTKDLSLPRSGRGAQTDWYSRTGLRTIMGNPQIERSSVRVSSCITCHARSAIGMDPTGMVKYTAPDFKTGRVDPRIFKTKKIVFYPLDFVWSLKQARDVPP